MREEKGVNQTTAAIDAHIEEHLPQTFDRLARLVAQPSVASRGEGMQECAELVARLLTETGFTARVMATSAMPAVYAEAGSGDRTLLCYNHYDVQPEEPVDLWDSPPFEMVEHDGKLYGRGIGDDKGEIISRLAALDAIRSVLGDFPCRIKFLIEGGEEIGSPGLPDFVAAHRDLLAADACIWEGGGVDYKGRPSLTLGMRGILYVQFSVRTLSHDAHSGNAHVIPNAAWHLVRALNSIKDAGERILIPGFYDDVRPMSELDRTLFERLVDPEVEAEEKRFLGTDTFVGGLSGREALEAVFRPTANICGLDSGYQGEGLKTVIPAQASAKMDFRLVPDQDPEDIYRKLRAHLDRGGFGDVDVQLLGAESPAVTPYSDAFVQLTAVTAEEVYGEPVMVRPIVGGSGPFHAFRHYLEVPIATLGIGYPESRAHAPNENIRISNFILGTRHMAHLVERWGKET
jgi:acetylornithine deacetylase/succinyl-diaminopimelate desuccinylase-like protein